MTESVVALPHGSPSRGSDSPRASARARVNRSVTHRDRTLSIKESRPVLFVRRVSRVVYLDTADSWILNEDSPAPKKVWKTDYTAAVPGGYKPFVRWCRAWRYPAVILGSACDGAKWFLIHPVRGPLTITAVGTGVAAVMAG